MWPFGKNTATRVKEALEAQPQLRGTSLDVQDNRGAVALRGSVPTESHVRLAQAVAQGINGVKTVDVSGLRPQQANQPVQRPPQPQTQRPQAQQPQPQQSGQMAPDRPQAPPSQGQPPQAQQAQLQAQQAQPGANDIENSSALARAAYQAIRQHPQLQNDPIDVLQSGQTVILRGAVDNDAEKQAAEALARAVPGVSAVDTSGLKVLQGVRELAAGRNEQGEVVHTVKAGDTLSQIAQRYYGDMMRYHELARHNGIKNPDHIEVGQQIRIPGLG